MRKELWSSNAAGMRVFLGNAPLNFKEKNISAHITVIADWELEGLDEAKILKKMRRIKFKRVLVKLKKIVIFPVGEHLIAGYQVDVIREYKGP